MMINTSVGLRVTVFVHFLKFSQILVKSISFSKISQLCALFAFFVDAIAKCLNFWRKNIPGCKENMLSFHNCSTRAFIKFTTCTYKRILLKFFSGFSGELLSFFWHRSRLYKRRKDSLVACIEEVLHIYFDLPRLLE